MIIKTDFGDYINAETVSSVGVRECIDCYVVCIHTTCGEGFKMSKFDISDKRKAESAASYIARLIDWGKYEPCCISNKHYDREEFKTAMHAFFG